MISRSSMNFIHYFLKLLLSNHNDKDSLTPSSKNFNLVKRKTKKIGLNSSLLHIYLFLEFINLIQIDIKKFIIYFYIGRK